MTVIDKNTTFMGYRRENGRVGIRNHVIILPLDDLSNSAAEAVAHNIKGAIAWIQAYTGSCHGGELGGGPRGDHRQPCAENRQG